MDILEFVIDLINDQIYFLIKSRRYNLIDEVIGLLSINHQFESRKPQSHWNLTWSLISRPVKLMEMRARWLEHSRYFYIYIYVYIS